MGKTIKMENKEENVYNLIQNTSQTHSINDQSFVHVNENTRNFNNTIQPQSPINTITNPINPDVNFNHPIYQNQNPKFEMQQQIPQQPQVPQNNYPTFNQPQAVCPNLSAQNRNFNQVANAPNYPQTLPL